MVDVLKLNNDYLKDIGVSKLKHRIVILEEIERCSSTRPSKKDGSTVEEKDSVYSTTGGQFSQKYRKDTFIGRGSFGEAWKVKPKQKSHGVFIMKEIHCSEKDVDKGRNEIEILKKCRHENIVSHIEDFYERSKFMIIMEFCDGGDLAEFIETQKQPLSVDKIMDWFRQMTSGVSFIHNLKIIHRDLKPANIFLTSDKKLKIGDFGIAKTLDKTSGLASTYCGTAVYMAPEIHGGEKFDKKADVWSLGCIVYELVALKPAFLGKILAICKEWLLISSLT